jgi:hypothetical protein
MKSLITILTLFIGSSLSAQVAMKSVTSNYGAIAVDLSDYRIYGLAYDAFTQKAAEKQAMKECKKNGGKCSTVVSFSGEGCALLMYSPTNQKIGVWVVAKTKYEADEIAQQKIELLNLNNDEIKSIWVCNARFSQPLKVITLKER